MKTFRYRKKHYVVQNKKIIVHKQIRISSHYGPRRNVPVLYPAKNFSQIFITELIRGCVDAGFYCAEGDPLGANGFGAGAFNIDGEEIIRSFPCKLSNRMGPFAVRNSISYISELNFCLRAARRAELDAGSRGILLLGMDSMCLLGVAAR
ncbi:hypothetical protein EVAR_50020_1 [Eumeta japonica]|uniref:Uncharacterized protein n=1 Tax=Eumeta variegata TaxID=151549 RepID=A0A4C1YMV8_EUMVA|nr:hypothetical protein EVAR_50020_1 [Eumeta japonica]